MKTLIVCAIILEIKSMSFLRSDAVKVFTKRYIFMFPDSDPKQMLRWAELDMSLVEKANTKLGRTFESIKD